MNDLTKVAESDLPFYMKQSRGVGPITPKDDLLHPDSFKGVTDDTATETQYFGFSIPEENIHALTYMWWHPNLKVCSGGIYVFKGFKNQFIDAEICDWHTYMSDKAIANDLHEFRFVNGYGVKVLEPNKRFHITYDNDLRKNSVDLQVEAVQPGVMWADGKHFEQTMKVRGSLVIKGKSYKVDCYTVRDRSWGKPRPEFLTAMPPVSWMVCTFNDNFSFNCTMFDQARNNPLLPSSLSSAMPDDKTLVGGWVIHDGKVGGLVKAEKRVTRAPGTMISTGIDLSFVDEHDREFTMRASAIASCPQQPTHNVLVRINLMRWECNGLVGYGDNQENFWSDYLHAQP
jgi:hypothetical protein